MGSDQFSNISYAKKHQRKFDVAYPFHYMFQEQRFVCLLVGIAIACVLFAVIPSNLPQQNERIWLSDDSARVPRRVAYELHDGFGHYSAGIISC